MSRSTASRPRPPAAAEAAEPIEAEVRRNDRGGWEIAPPGDPHHGIGNYPTSADAYAIACYNFDPARIRIIESTAK